MGIERLPIIEQKIDTIQASVTGFSAARLAEVERTLNPINDRVRRIEEAIFAGAGVGLIISSASIANILQSTNFVTGVSGWRIEKSGDVEFENGIFRGAITAESGSFVGSVTIGTGGSLSSGQTAYNTGTGFWLEYNAGTPRFSLGVAGAAGLTWDGSALAVTGAFTATSGNITGTLYVGASPPRIIIDGSAKVIKSENYSAGVAGWQIDKDGVAEFQNVVVRGTLQSTVFSYNEVSAVGGQAYVVQRAGTLRADVTTSGTFSIDIKDPDSGHVQLFSVNDILRITDAGTTNWLTVTSVVDNTTYYSYACNRSNGSATTFRAGTAVLSYGVSGDGYVLMDAQAATGPHISVATHAGFPWTTITERVRIGNLNGWGPFASDVYGFALGDYSGASYVYFDPATSNTKIVNGAGSVIIDKSGIVLTHGIADVNKLTWVSGATILSQLWADGTVGNVVGTELASLDQGNAVSHNIKLWAKSKTAAHSVMISMHSGETTTPSTPYIETTVRDASNVVSTYKMTSDTFSYVYNSKDIFTAKDTEHHLNTWQSSVKQTEIYGISHAVNGGTIYLTAYKTDATTSAGITIGTSGESIQFETDAEVFYLTDAGWRFGVTGQSVNEFSIDGTMAGNSDTAVPTEKAIVTYATPKTRTISTTAPLTGGGDLSTNRTFAVSAASTTASGVIELATQAEVDAGTDAVRAVAPSTLLGRTVESCRVYNNAALTIGNNAWTVMTYNSERWDDGGLHSTSSNTGRITFAKAGKYLVMGQANFAGNITGQRGIRIILGGATILASVMQDATQAFGNQFVVSTVYDFAATNYIEIEVFQNSGGNLNVQITGNYSPEASAIYLGF